MDKAEIVKKAIHKAMKEVEEFADKVVDKITSGLSEQVMGLIGLVKKILQMAINLIPNLDKHIELYAGHLMTMLGLVAVAGMIFNTAKYVVLAFYLKKAIGDRKDLAENVVMIDANLDKVATCLGDANTGFDALVEETQSLCNPDEPTDDDLDQLKSLRDGVAEPAKGLFKCFGELRKSKGMLESTIVSLGKAEVFQDSVILHILDISAKKKDGSEPNEVKLTFLKEPGAVKQKIVKFFQFFGRIRAIQKKFEAKKE